jgi:hypothetical protein
VLSVSVVAVPSVSVVESVLVISVQCELVTERRIGNMRLNANSALQFFELLIIKQRNFVVSASVGLFSEPKALLKVSEPTKIVGISSLIVQYIKVLLLPEDRR